jgi:hypothetical protein
MADYRLTATDIVIRSADNANIPADPINSDRMEYETWLADGGGPDPYVPPEPVPPTPTGEQTTLYDHENRLRAIEGAPPLTLVEFFQKTGSFE